MYDPKPEQQYLYGAFIQAVYYRGPAEMPKISLKESEKFSGKSPQYKLLGEALRLTIFAAVYGDF